MARSAVYSKGEAWVFYGTDVIRIKSVPDFHPHESSLAEFKQRVADWMSKHIGYTVRYQPEDVEVIKLDLRWIESRREPFFSVSVQDKTRGGWIMSWDLTEMQYNDIEADREVAKGKN